jgi:antitoxin (DNA-binding transcriptional repressor) of toxin-antitoxin stability system
MRSESKRFALVDRAANSGVIVIAKAGRPMARLVPLATRRGPRPLRMHRHEIWIGDDFDDPLRPEIQDAFEPPSAASDSAFRTKSGRSMGRKCVHPETVSTRNPGP